MDGDGTGDVCFVRESPSVSEPGVTYRVLGNDYTPVSYTHLDRDRTIRP